MVHFPLLKDTQLNCRRYLKVYMDLCNGFFETTRYSYLPPPIYLGVVYPPPARRRFIVIPAQAAIQSTYPRNLLRGRLAIAGTATLFAIRTTQYQCVIASEAQPSAAISKYPLTIYQHTPDNFIIRYSLFDVGYSLPSLRGAKRRGNLFHRHSERSRGI